MKIRDWAKFYLGYLSFLLSLAGLAVGINREYFVTQPFPWLVISLILVVAPVLLSAIAGSQGSLAKYARLLRFDILGFLRIEVFAAIGLAIFSFLTIQFLQNLFVNRIYEGEQVFNNVLLLNVFFVFFLVLVLGGKFQVRQPNALLIQQTGHPEIYLFQDGVLKHVPDPHTLVLAGYSFDDVVTVSGKEFESYQIGRPLESISKGKLLTNGTGEFWIVLGGVRRKIPNSQTLSFIRERNSSIVETLSNQELSGYAEGKRLRSVFDLN